MAVKKPGMKDHVKGLMVETLEGVTQSRVICEDGEAAVLQAQQGENLETEWDKAIAFCTEHGARDCEEIHPHVLNLTIRAKGNENHYAFSGVGVCKDGTTKHTISTLPKKESPPEDFLARRLDELEEDCLLTAVKEHETP